MTESAWMIESAALQLCFKLLLVTLAIFWQRGILLWMDKVINNVDFFKTLEECHPDRRMSYYAARYVGTCLLVGLVLS